MIRLRNTDVEQYVRDVLVHLNNGLYAARVKGVQVEMPEFIDFNLEVVFDVNGFDRPTQQNGGGYTVTQTQDAVTDTQTQDAVTDTQTQDAVTDTQTQDAVTDTKTQNNTGGGRITVHPTVVTNPITSIGGPDPETVETRVYEPASSSGS